MAKRTQLQKSCERGRLFQIHPIDRKDIEVSAEVYTAYSQMDRRKRYLYEREDGHLLSLEQLAADNVPLSSLTDKLPCYTEDTLYSQITDQPVSTHFPTLSDGLLM